MTVQGPMGPVGGESGWAAHSPDWSHHEFSSPHTQYSPPALLSVLLLALGSLGRWLQREAPKPSVSAATRDMLVRSRAPGALSPCPTSPHPPPVPPQTQNSMSGESFIPCSKNKTLHTEVDNQVISQISLPPPSPQTTMHWGTGPGPSMVWSHPTPQARAGGHSPGRESLEPTGKANSDDRRPSLGDKDTPRGASRGGGKEGLQWS